MKRKPVWACLAAVVAAGSLAAPQLGVAAGGKSHKVNEKCTFRFLKGSKTKFAGPCTGSLGKGTASGTLVIPQATVTFKVKGGTATLKYDGDLESGGKVTGNWKWSKGTGTFKGISGTGIANGNDKAVEPYTYTGTATY